MADGFLHRKRLALGAAEAAGTAAAAVERTLGRRRPGRWAGMAVGAVRMTLAVAARRGVAALAAALGAVARAGHRRCAVGAVLTALAVARGRRGARRGSRCRARCVALAALRGRQLEAPSSASAAAKKSSGSGRLSSFWRVSRSMSRSSCRARRARRRRSPCPRRRRARCGRCGGHIARARRAGRKLKTWLTPGMSIPRAAMSVATSTGIWPERNGGERALALRLALVAVDRAGGDAGAPRAGGRSCRRHAWCG